MRHGWLIALLTCLVLALCGCALLPEGRGIWPVPKPLPAGASITATGTIVMGDQRLGFDPVAYLGIASSEAASSSGVATFTGTAVQLEGTQDGPAVMTVWQAASDRSWDYRTVRCEVTTGTVLIGKPDALNPRQSRDDAASWFLDEPVRVVGRVEGDVVVCDSVATAPGARLTLPWPEGTIESPVGVEGSALAHVQFFLVDGSAQLTRAGRVDSMRDFLVQQREDWDAFRMATHGVPAQEATARLVVTSDAVYARQIELP